MEALCCVLCPRLCESRRLDEMMRVRRLTAMDDMEKGACYVYTYLYIHNLCLPSHLPVCATEPSPYPSVTVAGAQRSLDLAKRLKDVETRRMREEVERVRQRQEYELRVRPMPPNQSTNKQTRNKQTDK